MPIDSRRRSPFVNIDKEMGVEADPEDFELRSRPQSSSSWPREAAEGGVQRKSRRWPACAARRHRGDHVRLMTTLLRVIHGSKQSTTGAAPNHGYREDSPRLAATHQTGDRLRCRTERSSYLGHAMLITPILIYRHRVRSFSVNRRHIPKKASATLRNLTPRVLCCMAKCPHN